MAGANQPEFGVVGVDRRAPPHRRLLSDMERALASGELRDSELGPLVLKILQQETDVGLAKPYDPDWVTTGISVADFYFRLIRPSAGVRDWQRDLAKVVTPILVGVVRSLARSPDAQAVVVRLCEGVAGRLRLTLVWPDDPDELNDVRNALYRKCHDAQEVESDSVLIVLQGLTVVGPD